MVDGAFAKMLDECLYSVPFLFDRFGLLHAESMHINVM